MKYLLILFFIFLNINTLLAQKYMDTIVEESCKCVSELPDTVKPENYTMELGLCMIKVSMPYKKQLKKDFDIDMDNIAESGEELGGLIGSRMVGKCPNELISMTEKTNAAKTDNEVIEQFDDNGTIIKIEDDFFITFYLKGENGKTNKYYWLSFIETKEDLIYNYTQLKGKKVEIEYIKDNFFDPKISDYRQFQIITKLKIKD